MIARTTSAGGDEDDDADDDGEDDGEEEESSGSVLIITLHLDSGAPNETFEITVNGELSDVTLITNGNGKGNAQIRIDLDAPEPVDGEDEEAPSTMLVEVTLTGLESGAQYSATAEVTLKG